MDRVRFVAHKGKQILLIDCSNCSPKEAIAVANECNRVMRLQPRESVLSLPDMSGVKVDKKAVERFKEVAALNQPYVKRSAMVGAESLSPALLNSIQYFSTRQFTTFPSREEAMEWLVKE